MTVATAGLGLSETIGFVRDYDGRIDTIWNIYLVGISAVIAAANVKSWQPRAWLLVPAFAVLALGNLWALSRYYAAHHALLEHAAQLAPPAGLIDALRLPSVPQLAVFHLAIDTVSAIAIFLFCRRAAAAEPGLAGEKPAG